MLQAAIRRFIVRDQGGISPYPAVPLRVVRLGEGTGTWVETVIPPEIYRNDRFLYVGVEIFLPESGIDTAQTLDYARRLLIAPASD